MFASSFLGASFETVIPEPVRQALNLLEGDLLVFEVDETGSVVLKKSSLAASLETLNALQETLPEWASPLDEEAYHDL